MYYERSGGNRILGYDADNEIIDTEIHGNYLIYLTQRTRTERRYPFHES